MENKKRTKTHRKNQELEDVLKELENLLGHVGEEKRFMSSHPIVFIMGCARSGTTLLSQLLAAATDWCYPSNLISRFYYAPYIGSLIQKMLFDLDTKGELLGEFKHKIGLTSSLGKTKGALSPHEFWYYWRRFFHFGEIQYLSEKDLEKVKFKAFNNGLKSIQYVFDRPLFLKGMILNWNIPYLARILPNSIFVHVVRDIRFNAQSLLFARKMFFDNYGEWYSFKPPEYCDLINLTPEEQVVSQVHYTNMAIRKGMKTLPSRRVFTLEYESMCKEPIGIIKELSGKVDSQDASLNQLNISLTNNNQIRTDPDTWQKIQKAAAKFSL